MSVQISNKMKYAISWLPNICFLPEYIHITTYNISIYIDNLSNYRLKAIHSTIVVDTYASNFVSNFQNEKKNGRYITICNEDYINVLLFIVRKLDILCSIG